MGTDDRYSILTVLMYVFMHEVLYYRYKPSIVFKENTHLYRCALLFILSILGKSWRKGNIEIKVLDGYIWVNL